MQLNFESEGQEALANMSAITSDTATQLEHEYQVGRKAKGKEKKAPKAPPAPAAPKVSEFDRAASRAAIHSAATRAMKKQIKEDNAVDAHLKEKVELCRKISEYQKRFGTIISDRSHYTVKTDVDVLRAAHYTCQADVSSRAAEGRIRSLVLGAPLAMEKATAFVNPLDWDLTGFGALSSDPDFAEALETELSEAVIEVCSFHDGCASDDRRWHDDQKTHIFHVKSCAASLSCLGISAW